MPRILLLQVGCATLGLDVESIQDVIADPPLFSVPRAGAFLLGVINLHGQVLPVIDLPGLLGADAARRDHRLVVLTPRFHSLALATSRVGRMAAFEAAVLRPPTAAERANAIAGVVTIADEAESVNLLDPGMIVERLKTIYAA
jgi:chemotaxis signal transduction protein